MDNNFITALLPFWILGVPFVVALISLAKLPARKEHIARGGHNAVTTGA